MKASFEQLPPGWAYAAIPKEGQTVYYAIVDRRDKENPVFYLNEQMMVTSLKCMGLLIKIFPYGFGFVTLHLIRAPLALFYHQSLSAFGKEVWEVVRAPFYCIALEFAALYGIFKPLEGRALFASLEKSLHDGKNRKDRVEYNKSALDSTDAWDALLLKENQKTLFIAFCFQAYNKPYQSTILEEADLEKLRAASLQDGTRQSESFCDRLQSNKA
jgi:hypothetical protein